MSTWLWAGVLVLAVWAAHWGAERLSEPLKKLRKQWGFSAAAGGAFIGLAAASPEIGINTASAIRGVSDIGLGAALGSNVLAIPLVVSAAYWASRKERLGDKGSDNSGDENAGEGESPAEHAEHRRTGLLRVQREAVTVQALPYIGVVALFALLTLPSGWRGLQSVDGWILLAAYGLYLAQALFRGREDSERVEWTKKEIGMAVAGVAVLAVGAYFTVRATENIVSALAISNIIGGMFLTAPMAALPELFAVKSVVRSGQVTSAITSVIGDHAVTMTIAFLPLALAGLPVENLPLLITNLVFVALVPALYALLIHWRGGTKREHGFTLGQTLLLDGVLLLWIGVVLFGVLNIL